MCFIISDDFSVDSARSTIATLIVGIVFITFVVFLVWKWRKNNMGETLMHTQILRNLLLCQTNLIKFAPINYCQKMCG